MSELTCPMSVSVWLPSLFVFGRAFVFIRIGGVKSPFGLSGPCQYGRKSVARPWLSPAYAIAYGWPVSEQHGSHPREISASAALVLP